MRIVQLKNGEEEEITEAKYKEIEKPYLSGDKFGIKLPSGKDTSSWEIKQISPYVDPRVKQSAFMDMIDQGTEYVKRNTLKEDDSKLNKKEWIKEQNRKLDTFSQSTSKMKTRVEKARTLLGKLYSIRKGAGVAYLYAVKAEYARN